MQLQGRRAECPSKGSLAAPFKCSNSAAFLGGWALWLFEPASDGDDLFYIRSEVSVSID